MAHILMAFCIASCTVELCSSAEIGNQPSTNHIVEIKSFEFLPSKLQVNAGDTITWINRDIVPHTATAINDEWDSGVLLQNESETLTVSKTFQSEYFCRFHINMTGSITTESAPD